MSVMPIFEWIQLTLFLSCSISPIIILSIFCCVVTIFCSCVLLRDHISLLNVITGHMHSLCTFIFQPQWYAFVLHNRVQLAKSGPTKACSVSQLLFLTMVYCHHLSEVDVAVNFFDLPSIDADVHFVSYRIAHDFSLSQVHIETYWFAGFMDVM